MVPSWPFTESGIGVSQGYVRSDVRSEWPSLSRIVAIPVVRSPLHGSRLGLRSLLLCTFRKLLGYGNDSGRYRVPPGLLLKDPSRDSGRFRGGAAAAASGEGPVARRAAAAPGGAAAASRGTAGGAGGVRSRAGHRARPVGLVPSPTRVGPGDPSGADDRGAGADRRCRLRHDAMSPGIRCRSSACWSGSRDVIPTPRPGPTQGLP